MDEFRGLRRKRRSRVEAGEVALTAIGDVRS
jgi:hypothetical protein